MRKNLAKVHSRKKLSRTKILKHLNEEQYRVKILQKYNTNGQSITSDNKRSTQGTLDRLNDVLEYMFNRYEHNSFVPAYNELRTAINQSSAFINNPIKINELKRYFTRLSQLGIFKVIKKQTSPYYDIHGQLVKSGTPAIWAIDYNVITNEKLFISDDARFSVGKQFQNKLKKAYTYALELSIPSIPVSKKNATREYAKKRLITWMNKSGHTATDDLIEELIDEMFENYYNKLKCMSKHSKHGMTHTNTCRECDKKRKYFTTNHYGELKEYDYKPMPFRYT